MYHPFAPVSRKHFTGIPINKLLDLWNELVSGQQSTTGYGLGASQDMVSGQRFNMVLSTSSKVSRTLISQQFN